MANHGSFSGQPDTEWLAEAPAHTDRRMKLLSDFSFLDPNNKPWNANKGDTVDGASIPRALWSLVGSPYTGNYRRASIVHDIACDQAQGDPDARAAADRMFFHACMAGYCSWLEAAILYVGVRFGAWIDGDKVNPWKAQPSEDDARTTFSAQEQRIQADFRLVAENVVNQGKTESAEEIEQRTNKAAREVLGLLPQ